MSAPLACPFVIRPVTCGDRDPLNAYFASLSDTRRSGRFRARRGPTPEDVARLCTWTIPGRRLWIAQAGELIVGEAGYRQVGPTAAELKLSVRTGHGDDEIAAALIDRCRTSAKEHGLWQLRAYARPTDSDMQRWLGRHADPTWPGPPQLTEYVLQLPSPGDALRRVRLAHGLSQGGLARLIGVSRVMITLTEAGKRRLGPARVKTLVSKLGLTSVHLGALRPLPRAAGSLSPAADVLRRALWRLEMSEDALAEVLGVREASVRAWITGRRTFGLQVRRDLVRSQIPFTPEERRGIAPPSIVPSTAQGRAALAPPTDDPPT